MSATKLIMLQTLLGYECARHKNTFLFLEVTATENKEFRNELANILLCYVDFQFCRCISVIIFVVLFYCLFLCYGLWMRPMCKT